MTSPSSQLGWDVFVAPPAPIVTDDPGPGTTEPVWSPITATLISGARDAVLVDPLLTVEQARGLADWVAASGKNLTAVYVTHGHGDHWFGLGVILDRFPAAHAAATPAVAARMRAQAAPDVVSSFWSARFPGQIPEPLVLAGELDGGVIELEGHDLVAISLGHTDTDDTTCLHVPSIGLVVAGDSAYNDVHMYLAESGQGGRRDWIAALNIIEALRPTAVVAGHKRAGRPDSPRIIEESRQYVRDFDTAAQQAGNATELYEQMLARYPDRVNPGALWASARAVMG